MKVRNATMMCEKWEVCVERGGKRKWGWLSLKVQPFENISRFVQLLLLDTNIVSTVDASADEPNFTIKHCTIKQFPRKISIVTWEKTVHFQQTLSM